MPDSSLPRGVQLFQKPNSRFWYVSFKDAAGRRVRKSTGEVDYVLAVDEGIRLAEEAVALPFKQAAVDFFKARSQGPNALSPNTLKGYRFSLKAVAPYVAELSMDKIDQSVLKTFVRERKRQVTDASVRRDLAFLSTVFAFAQETYDSVPEANPIMMFNKRRLKEVKREHYLTLGQYKELDKACTSKWQRIMIWTAVCTGMRHGELLAFRHSWIDWEKGTISLPKEVTKGNKARVIPIFEQLRGPLQDWCANLESDHVFTYYDHALDARVPFTSFNNSWRGIRKRAGLEYLRLHDLRHTFASWWVQDGGDLKVLSKIMGHSTTQVTDRYAKLSTEATQAAAAQRNWHTYSQTEEEL